MARVAALLAEDYVGTQPVHPDRDFVGRAQVLEPVEVGGDDIDAAVQELYKPD